MATPFHRPALTLLILAAALAAARAETPRLVEARQALTEALPQIAIHKLRAIMASSDITGDEKIEATRLLGRALGAAGATEEALNMLQPLVSASDPEARLLRAGILASTGRWAEARPLYHALAAQPEAPLAATIGEAESLQALNRTDEALILLETAVHSGQAPPLVRLRRAVLLAETGQAREAAAALTGFKATSPEQTKWQRYTEARLLLLRDQAAPALALLNEITESREFLPESLLVAATFGEVEARLALRGTQQADDVLETFIWRNWGSAYLEQAFRRLDQIYAQEEDPSEVELQKWAQMAQPRRAALARFFLAKLQARLGHWEKAAATLEAFLKANPTHPLAGEASVMQAEMWTARNQLPEAVRSLEAAMRLTSEPEMRALIELRTGLAHFQQGEYLLAATLFEAASRHSAKLRPVATFNAALAWLHVQNFERFTEQYRAFLTLQPESPLRGELILEEGLVQARAGDDQATETLQSFLRDYPRHTRAPEARLALTEVAFTRGAAQEDLQLIANNDLPPAPEILAQSEYLAILLADARQPPDEERVIALAKQFLEKRPQATQVPEVRLKLGQVYYRRSDFANAETQFGLLAEGAPGPYTETAFFLAGKSAVKLINPGAVDRALSSFDRVVKLDGPFKLYARQEQAIVQSRLEHEDQALALYELILSTPGIDAELWQGALCGKGDNLSALGRRALPATDRLQEAIAVYDQLAAAPGVTPTWRNQALYKKAKALAQLGRGEDAQAAFYDVLNAPTDGQREYFWFYKAGFDAAHAYEQQENWKAAIGIYQKMAKLEGPRMAEVQSSLRQVRLKHFIWE